MTIVMTLKNNQEERAVTTPALQAVHALLLNR